jgi:hypothetical protein
VGLRASSKAFSGWIIEASVDIVENEFGFRETHSTVTDFAKFLG